MVFLHFLTQDLQRKRKFNS